MLKHTDGKAKNQIIESYEVIPPSKKKNKNQEGLINETAHFKDTNSEN